MRFYLYNILFFILGLFAMNTSFAQVRTSVNSGNWTTASTWDCGCVPAAGEDAVIDDGHTVALTGSTSITNITITTSGVLNHGTGNRQMTVSGNYINNGREISTTNGILNLTGSGTSISGTGLISISSAINITTGNKSILSGTDLTISDASISLASGINVSNAGTITLSNNLDGTDATSIWTNASSGTLAIGGTLFATAGTLVASASGNTINYFASGAQTVILPSSNTYDNLTLGGSGIKSAAGNLIVTGDLTMEGGTFDLTTNNYSLTLGGDFDNSSGGAFDEQLSTITFNGSGDQNINSLSAVTFYNFTNSSSGTVTSSVDITVSNSFTMSGSNINTGSNTITVGTSTASVGSLSYTSGTIIGNYQKWISTAGLYTFPIGSASNDNRVVIDITGITGGGGSLIASFVSTYPGTNGFIIDDSGTSIYNPFLEGYWDLTEANSLNISGYNLDLYANGFTSFTIETGTRLIMRPNSSSSWVTEGTHVSPSGNIIQRDGMSTISAQYAVGDITPCDPPTTSAITGSTTVCTNATGEIYSVTATSGSTYAWTVNGGSVTAGDGTESVTVTWGSTGMEGSIAVQETNDCTVGESVSITVNIESLPTDEVSGRTSVPENETGEVYSVTTRTGYSYVWSVSGGTITNTALSGGIAYVTVDWGSAGAGQVCVDASSGCGSAPQVCLDVNKYIIIESVGTGDYNVATTWDCACIPGASDNVKINTGHTVTLKTNTEIINMTVNGTLNADKKTLLITGDFTVNGTIIGSAAQGITVNGSGNVLDGVGTIANSGALTFEGGAKTIYSGASLTKSVGNVQVNGGIVVTNNGSFSVGSGNLDADNASSKWINSSNSTLVLGAGTFPTNGSLVASATGNTVQYNGTAAQAVYDTDYYNLSATGNNTITLQSNRTLGGDMYINSTTTFNANNNNLNVAGNWTNDGGTFTSGTGTVTFEGTSTQTIGGTKGTETFNNVVINSGSSVYIGSGTVVTATGSLTNNGTLDNDGQIQLANGYSSSGTLSGDGIHELTGGNWSNSGTFTAGSSKVLFSGSTAQTIAGATTFNDLEINNAGGVSVSSGAQNLTGTLTLTNGNFSTGGLLTLVSTASQTGRIAEITGGSISGNVTAQRYESGPESWRYVSAPTASTLADWQNEFWTAGYTGATYPSYYGFVSIYTHHENALGDYQRYTYATSSGDAITPGDGYLVWIGGWPIGNSYTGTIDVSGSVYTGTLVKTISYTALGDGYDGWNLVSNPYPSDIDLSMVTRSNVDNTAYVYDPSISDFISKSFSGGDIISQHQAFFVKASSAAGGTLTFNESSKTAGSSEFYKAAPKKQVYLYLEGQGYKHDVRVMLDNRSTRNYDGEFDAYQPRSLDYYAPYLSTLSANLDTLDINTIPDTVGDISIPILVRTGYGMSGKYTLSVGDIADLEDRTCVFLEDLTDNVTINLKEASSYTFYLSDTVTMPRFLLHLGGKVQVSSESVLCNDGIDGKVIVTASGSGPWDIIWKDEAGNIISTTNGTLTPVSELTGVSAGLYSAEVSNADGSCGVGKVSVYVSEPGIIRLESEITKVDCYGNETGAISVMSQGGTGNHTYAWSNGATSSTLNNLVAGNYMLSITDENGCLSVFEKEVKQPNKLELYNSTKEIACYGEANGSATIDMIGGNYPYSFNWSNGMTTATLVGLAAGQYNYSVTDTQGCFYSGDVSIEEQDQITAEFTLSADTIYLDEGGQVSLVNNSTGADRYNWNFGDGLVSSLENIDHTYSNEGTYVISLEASNSKCNASSQKTIEVLASRSLTGVEHLSNNNRVVITNDDQLLIIKSNRSLSDNYGIIIYDALGKEVYKESNIMTSTTEVNINNFNQGVYVATIQFGSEEPVSLKFSK